MQMQARSAAHTLSFTAHSDARQALDFTAQIGDVSEQVNVLDGNVTDLQAGFANLSGSVRDLQRDIKDLQSATSSLSDALASATAGIGGDPTASDSGVPTETESSYSYGGASCARPGAIYMWTVLGLCGLFFW